MSHPAEDWAKDETRRQDGEDYDSAEHCELVLLEADVCIRPETGPFFEDSFLAWARLSRGRTIHRSLGITEFGVHEDENEIGEQVGNAHQDAIEKNESEDEVVILRGDAEDEVLTHSWDEEDVLNDK